MKKIIIWVLAALSLISLSACANGKSSQKDNRNLLTSPINKDVTTMGTYIKVTVYDKGKEAAVEKALKLPVEYNNKWCGLLPSSADENSKAAPSISPAIHLAACRIPPCIRPP